jgi:glycosyltransferase involved in cell wall biosynthesis
MPSLPTLSVVVPNYNHAKYLEFSLPAILKQSFRPLEVLVLDDASKDNSVEVIRRFAAQDPLVRLVQNEKNLTVVPNLNKGVELARGDYVYIGAADDEVLPGIFEQSMRLLAQYPQAALSCTVCQWRYEESGLSFYIGVGMADHPAYISPADMIRIGKQGKLMISSSSLVFRRQALLDVGGFIPELRWLADWFAAYVSSFRYGLCFVPEPLSLVNIIPKSHYTHGSKQPEHLRILRRIVELINSPEFADVRPRVRDSGVFSLYATPMLKILLSRKEFRPFINPTFLRWTLWRNAELIGRDILPRWLARWVLNRFYALDKKPLSLKQT